MDKQPTILKDHFEFSEYPSIHILKNDKNKKVIGKMKDELGGRIMTEWVALRSKCYNYSALDSEDKNIESQIKDKGIQRCVIEKNLNSKLFKKCLFENKDNYQTVHSLHSKNHEMNLTKTNKLALNRFDTKRYICENNIDTKPFGYCVD